MAAITLARHGCAPSGWSQNSNGWRFLMVISIKGDKGDDKHDDKNDDDRGDKTKDEM